MSRTPDYYTWTTWGPYTREVWREGRWVPDTSTAFVVKLHRRYSTPEHALAHAVEVAAEGRERRRGPLSKWIDVCEGQMWRLEAHYRD